MNFRFALPWNRLVGFLCLLLWCARPVSGESSRVWEQQSYEDFLKGEAKGVSISSKGELYLAPSVEAFASLDVQRIWGMATRNGKKIYVGTGDSGKLFSIDEKGRIKLLFDSPELAIHALAVSEKGVVYAGTAPDGLIYRIEPSGQVSTLAHTGSHYVWDLAFDGSGTLCAATGDPGRILRISASGRTDTLFAPSERHVMTLAWAGGRLYAGTAQEARVYEISDEGKARLLFAAEEEEIHALTRTGEGVLYASAFSRADSPGDTSATCSAVYRIDPSGIAFPVWRAPGAILTALSYVPDWGLLAVSADPPRLYRLDDRGLQSLVSGFDDLSPGCLLQSVDGWLYLGDSHSGRIHRVSTRGYGSKGSFASSVEDFGICARWGRIQWRGERPESTSICFQTRSGNSRSPDATWSPWSEEICQSGASVPSPPARFLQYRILLKSTDPRRTPILHQIGVFARQVNLRPVISSLEVLPYRRARQRGNGQDSAPSVPPQRVDGRRIPPARSLFLVRWQAIDPNGDELCYSLYLRGLDQKEWKQVEEGISQTSVIWDTGTMPEGATLLKLVASDRSVNPEEEALQDERISPPFFIDNTPPRIRLRALEGAALTVEVEIEDEVTAVRKAQYSIDYSEHVHQIAAQDGLFDSCEEKARFIVEGLSSGEHVIAVQAWDSLDNVGTQQIVVQIK